MSRQEELGQQVAPAPHPSLPPCIHIPAAPLHSPLGLENILLALLFRSYAMSLKYQALYLRTKLKQLLPVWAVPTHLKGRTVRSLLPEPLTERMQHLTVCRKSPKKDFLMIFHLLLLSHSLFLSIPARPLWKGDGV